MATPLPSGRFLDPAALAALGHLRFSVRHRMEGARGGRHRSRRTGGTGEFADYRPYVDGEDLRRIDWKVLARTGRAYTRRHEDESDLCCLLVLDISGSMRFGEHIPGTEPASKLAYAQYLATALCHLIVRQQDRIALATIADGLHICIAAGGTASHARAVQEAIEKIETSPVSRMADGLHQLFLLSRGRGVLILMSDFLFDDPEAVFAGLRLFRHRCWEVIALHLVHPEEERLPEEAACRFIGLENEGHLDCSPEEIRRAYAERFEAHAAMIRTLARSVGCEYHRVSTGIPYLRTLSRFLVGRNG